MQMSKFFIILDFKLIKPLFRDMIRKVTKNRITTSNLFFKKVKFLPLYQYIEFGAAAKEI